MSMSMNELSGVEKVMIYEKRLSLLHLKQKHGSVDLISTVDESIEYGNRLLLSLHNNCSDRSESIFLSDDQCTELYELLRNRYLLRTNIIRYRKIEVSNEE